MRDTRPGLGGAVRQWGAEDRLLPSEVLKSGRTDRFPNCYDSKQAEREFSRNKEGRDRVGGSGKSVAYGELKEAVKWSGLLVSGDGVPRVRQELRRPGLRRGWGPAQ